MTIRARSFFVLLATLASLVAARADEPQAPKRDLQFEVSSELHDRYNMALPPATPEPNYVAVFKLKATPGQVSAIPWRLDGQEVFETPAGQSTSEQQKQYLGQAAYISPLNRPAFGPPDKWPETQTVEIWSPSEADARKMVEALLQWSDAKAAQALSHDQKELELNRATIALADKELPALKAKLDAETAERDGLWKVMSYSSGEDAARDMLQLDQALRSVAIDMAAIQAKTEAIGKVREKYLNLTPGKAETMFAFLDQMSATQDIDMAGILARKSALEAARKKAEHYRDLVQRVSGDERRLHVLQEKRRVAENTVRNNEKDLADPPIYMRPLQVVGKVMIYRTGGPSAKPPQTMPGTAMPTGGGPRGPGIAPK